MALKSAIIKKKNRKSPHTPSSYHQIDIISPKLPKYYQYTPQIQQKDTNNLIIFLIEQKYHNKMKS
jgi:hypothetical protein